VLDFIAAAPGSGRPCRRSSLHAPVLILPRVFEPELCRRLIAAYEADGGRASGFMRDVDGKTRLILDATHKRRRDHELVDPALRHAAAARVRDRLIPEVAEWLIPVPFPQEPHYRSRLNIPPGRKVGRRHFWSPSWPTS
jgi:hypothetical protein